MDTKFLKELYEKGYFSIHEKFEDWHDCNKCLYSAINR